MMNRDTIAAIATASGEGSIAIVRLSGPDAHSIGGKIFRRARIGDEMRHYVLYYGEAVEACGRAIDECMMVTFPKGKSYTKEPVCELQCHGGQMAADRILRRALNLGARAAEPGEFTKRAFLNGRIDLPKAESVMAMIHAQSEAAARAAARQLQGGVSRFVVALSDQLGDLLAAIEAGNDFPDEIDDDVTINQVRSGIADVRGKLSEAADPDHARIVREGLSIVLCGAPNVGKSSLMNALLGQDRAIVTDIAGTTRDVLTERMRINRFNIELSDTAGRRASGDVVERIGIEKAIQAQSVADLALLIVDASRPLNDEDRQLIKDSDARTVIVLNKCDVDELHDVEGAIHVSAKTGLGMDALRSVIADKLNDRQQSEHQMTAVRHIDAAQQAIGHLDMAMDALDHGMPVDVAAVDLMGALACLTDILGIDAPESVIDRIFAQFCVGK